MVFSKREESLSIAALFSNMFNVSIEHLASGPWGVIMPNGEAYPYPYPLYGPLCWYEAPEEAPHLGHSKHLCDMVKRGADLQMYKDLVRHPKFTCNRCGRAAAKEENLCEGVPP